jgi:hypothetical protein
MNALRPFATSRELIMLHGPPTHRKCHLDPDAVARASRHAAGMLFADIRFDDLAQVLLWLMERLKVDSAEERMCITWWQPLALRGD